MPAATALLAAAVLAAVGSLQFRIRSEVRGIEGGPPGRGTLEMVPYEVDPAVVAALLPEQPLWLELAYLPRILFYAGPDGGHEVRSVTVYNTGSASAAWSPDRRLRLSLTGSASRGILETSPLAQFSAAAAPGQPAPVPLEPAAGVRTGRHGSESVRLGVDWRTTQTLALAGSAAYSSSGGTDASARRVFPRREDLSAEARAAVAATAVDRLGVGASLAQTHLAGEGSAEFLGLASRWERRLGTDTSGTLGAGFTMTVEDSTPFAQTSRAAPIAPQAEASLAKAPPAQRPGLGASVRLSYAPYVDQYAARVRQRLAADARLDWLATERMRITAGLFGGTAVGASRLGPGAVAGELAIWSRRPEWEVGLALRAGYQEGDVPGGTFSQWGISLVAGSAVRGSL